MFSRIGLCLLLAVGLGACSERPAPPEAADKPSREAPAPAVPQDAWIGTWITDGKTGETFEVVLFPDNQAVGTWAKGPAGARGQRGLWRADASGVTVFLGDGWTDRIEAAGDGFVHKGFAAGTPLDAHPTNQAAARKLSGEEAGFVGVWRLNKDFDGNFLYITLQSSGRALSTLNGGTEGRWEIREGAAICSWPDGWTDRISRTGDGYRKESWVGAPQGATPPDLTEAIRVGEKPFTIAP